GFLQRDWRENDYLWGRFDGAGRPLHLVLGDSPGQGLLGAAPPHRAAFEAVITQERRTPRSVGQTLPGVERERGAEAGVTGRQAGSRVLLSRVPLRQSPPSAKSYFGRTRSRKRAGRGAPRSRNAATQTRTPIARHPRIKPVSASAGAGVDAHGVDAEVAT